MSLILSGDTGVPVTTVTGTLPVANGGTGVTTSTGSGAVVLGTSPTLTTPALGTPSALVGTNISGTSNSFVAGIAVNQTWQNVAGSRVSGTTYTNTTGKPIMVCIVGSAASIVVTVGGVTVFPTSGSYGTSTFAVPDSQTYRVTNAGFQGWVELR